MSQRPSSLLLAALLSTLTALAPLAHAAPGANSPFAGMSQREMWCQVLNQGVSSPARKAHAREECFGKLARFDKVETWQGRITLIRHYTCAERSGTKTVHATFSLKRTPFVSNADVASAIRGQAPAAVTVFQHAMARMPGAKVVIRRNPTTGYTESPNELSWFLTGGKLDASIGTHSSDGETSHSENGSGSAPIAKQARLIFDLEQGTWSLELPPVNEKGFPVTFVTTNSEGTTTENDRESLDDLNSLDGFTDDRGLNKLPADGLQLAGHTTLPQGDCERDELTWRLVPAADCASYKYLTLGIEEPVANARWIFDRHDTPAGLGPVRIDGGAEYGQDKVVVNIDDMVQWTPPNIPGTTFHAKPADLYGTPVTLAYTGMPANNSDFGKTALLLQIPDLPNCVAPERQPVRLFFARDGHGNPEGKRDPNWFYYWLQTKAGAGHTSKDVVFDPKCDPKDFGYFEDKYPFSARVQICPAAKGVTASRDLYGEVAFGIDQFALTVRHEFVHKMLYDQGLRAFDASWYHKYGFLYFKRKDYLAAKSKLDPDGDGLTADEERKYGLSPKLRDTHCTGADDNEYLAYTISTRQWKLGSADKQDWACPGRQGRQSGEQDKADETPKPSDDCLRVRPSPGRTGHWPGCAVHSAKRRMKHVDGGTAGRSGPQLRSLAMSSQPAPSGDAPSGTTSEMGAPRVAAPVEANGDEITRIQAGLQSRDPMIRLRALRDLAGSGGGPAPATSAKQILGALASELNGPAAPEPIRNGYLPQGAWRRVQYARLSAELPDKALTVIYQRYIKASGPMKTWLAITLGDAGDARVTGELIALARRAPDWPTRWAATEALGAIGSPEAIRTLEDVMQHDSATTTPQTDVRGATTFYPVREQAAGALMRLGIEVHLVGPDTYVVDKSAPNPQPSVVR